MIHVTKPFLPPISEYNNYVKGIWDRQWLTNNGPLVNELELKLKDYLKINHLLYLNNGTIALQIAIKALELTGEIITTPFSFVATTSTIVWENCMPVFVDIDPDTLTIDVNKIEAAITEKTSGIVVTHVYGNSCDIDAIEAIAKKHNLKVIYDAAHSFGVEYKGKSVFAYGDVSTTSFHATKSYHTIEGGAVFTNDTALLKKMSHMRNFGFDGPERFIDLGINGKNSEFHAAMGILNLNYINDIVTKRKALFDHYKTMLQGLNVKYPVWNPLSTNNYGYFPVIFKNEEELAKSISVLNINNIYPRRYFYPSLSNSLPYRAGKGMTISEDISKRVLCLPLYYDLSFEEINLICRLLLRVQNN